MYKRPLTIIRYKSTRNAAGIYSISEKLRSAVFNESNSLPSNQHGKLAKLSLSHLKSHNIPIQTTKPPPHIDFELPRLLGSGSLDTHFQKIGNYMLEPYIHDIYNYISSNIPDIPNDFELRPGWTQYKPSVAKSGESKVLSVAYPPERVITFDTEVLTRESDYAVLATAVSSDAWYVWISPWLLNKSNLKSHLVPLGGHEQVVIGHNIGYDRKRVKEEYSIKPTKKWFMDTMSLHIACNGMCNQQRSMYSLYQRKRRLAKAYGNTNHMLNNDITQLENAEPWLKHTSSNSLSSVVKFHLRHTLDKTTRNVFTTSLKTDIQNTNSKCDSDGDTDAGCADLKTLIEYCAKDSFYTKHVFDVLFPKFRKLNPHPINLAVSKELSSAFLPVSNEWDAYLECCEQHFKELQRSVKSSLQKLAINFLNSPINARKTDPYLSQLDWTVQMGEPKWYRELFVNGKMQLSTRNRLTVLLLRLRWDEYPLNWNHDYGWCITVPKSRIKKYKSANFTLISRDKNLGTGTLKLPHPDGSNAKCQSVFTKFYSRFFESGELWGDCELARDVISVNLQCAYWSSARRRITSQMAVFQSSETTDMQLPKNWGMILPRVSPMGTITKRVVEDTWLTAANAKKHAVGSELKSQVKAPPLYKFVGADVDSEELWISSVIGDSVFQMHGGTALGWMTLEGSKKAKTDMHSKSATILGIQRNEAKILNYSRIYGAGSSYAARILRQYNPHLTNQEAKRKARQLYRATKGIKKHSSTFPLTEFWAGGTESIVFNQLELLAKQPRQVSPILGGGITDALKLSNLKSTEFLTTRVNWSIQTSGVDYLHLLVASMFYLCKVYNIKARLLLTVHDEVRYMVKEEDQLRAALALQISNLWTRAMFCQQLQFNDIPNSVAFFSSVDVDNVFRKESNDPCITPTQKTSIPDGESLSINELVEKCPSLGQLNKDLNMEFENMSSVLREPIMKQVQKSGDILGFVEAQISKKK